MTATPASTQPDQVARLGAIALAVGSVAAPLPASAAPIVYSTPQQIPLSIGFDPATGAIGPGVPIQFSIDAATAFPNSAGSITGQGGNLVATNGAVARSLAAGTTVGPDLFESGGASSADIVKNGSKFSPSPYFVGLDIKVPSLVASAKALAISPIETNYYGYAAFNDVDSITSYAFEDLPDTPIVIPSAAVVAEPASLAILALGAVGVAALRRRARTRAPA